MVFSGNTIAVQGTGNIRPFATLLKTMQRLDGVLSRDEMIVGPLSMSDDSEKSSFDAMCAELSQLRKNSAQFRRHMAKILNDRKISMVTARNYTRFPLGALKWLGWAVPALDLSHYDRRQNVYVMKEAGSDFISQYIDGAVDIRLANFNALNNDEAKILCHYSFYNTLSNSGFDISDVEPSLNTLTPQIQAICNSSKIIFSPFQMLQREELSEIFDEEMPNIERVSVYSPKNAEEKALEESLKDLIIPKKKEVVPVDDEFSVRVRKMSKDKSVNEIVELIKLDCIGYSKEQFYPLIGQLFATMGLVCDIPPHGVNSRRWDAIVISGDDSIPIEIKSPTEELHLSVKAIRQAVENKIILQSREAVPNKWHTSTYALGFNLPNDRSEVSQLIADMKNVYDIDIAVMGIDSILTLAIQCILEKKVVLF